MTRASGVFPAVAADLEMHFYNIDVTFISEVDRRKLRKSLGNCPHGPKIRRWNLPLRVMNTITQNISSRFFRGGDSQRFDYVPECRLFPRFQNPP